VSTGVIAHSASSVSSKEGFFFISRFDLVGPIPLACRTRELRQLSIARKLTRLESSFEMIAARYFLEKIPGHHWFE